MRLGQNLREVAVAFVRDDDRGAGFGDQEVRARDADVGGQKPLTQHGARFGQQLHGFGEVAGRVEMRVDAPEVLLHLRGGGVNRRRDDVRWHLVAKLDDVFAEVGLDRRDAVGLKVVVEADLLGDHRLALGDGARARLPADFQNRLARLLGRARVVDVAACGRHPLLVSL